MPVFIPGIELGRRFYFEAVRPILDQHYPGLAHAAAIIGSGSDVLGFDTEMSTDHWWGPIVYLFVRESDLALEAEIQERMAFHLPDEIAGYPVNFGDSSAEAGMDVMRLTTERPLKHHVFVTTVGSFTQSWLNYDVAQALTAADWLSLPSEKLLEMTAGAVHFDNIGDLTHLRQRLSWYPHDVWLYLLACGWQRIGQEEHLMPRAGYAGDELGSALIGSRLVRDIMSLCFLMEKRYAPYPKWLGTAFKRLQCGGDLAPLLWQAQLAETWQTREQALGAAYTYLAQMHQALNLTVPLPDEPSNFFSRPFQVIHGSQFTEALFAQITDPEVKRLTERPPIGGIDQWSDSTDLRSSMSLRPVIRNLYR